ncbi:MAG: heparinase II/III family protein, partial [Armatimonadota bacterium]
MTWRRPTALAVIGLVICAAIAILILPNNVAVADETNMTGIMDHPCVLLNPEAIPHLRAKAADMKSNRFGFSTGEIWHNIQAKADRFLNAAPYHYSVKIPMHGGAEGPVWEYTLSDKTPPRHDDTPHYPPWTAMTQEQRDDAITVRIKYLSMAYLVTGETKYAERAKQIVMHLTHWDYWTDRSYTAGRTRACLDTGHLTKCVGLFYDWCYDTLTDAERAQIREALIEKGLAMCAADLSRYQPETNGYAVLTSGLACGGLAVRPEDPRGGEFLQTAIEATLNSFSMSGEDGGLFEGPMYGTYLMDNFAHVLDAVTAADVESGLFEHPFLQTLDEYVISNMTPDGKVMPCFGDGSPTRGYPETMSILANRGHHGAAWYLDEIGALRPTTIHQFLRFDPDVLQIEQPTFNPSRPFVDIGLAILRDGYEPHRPYLALKSGPWDNTIGHLHYDHNAFVLSYLGEWLISDRGYRARYHAASTKFSLGTIGHASMVMDIDEEYLNSTEVPASGHDQVTRTGGKIEQFFSCDAFDYVAAQAAPAYNKETTVLDDFTRRIFYFKPYMYVMADTISAPEPHSYNILLQAAPKSIVKQQDDRWTIDAGRARLNCWTFSPQGVTTEALTFPDAERYGYFIRAYTPSKTSAEFMTVMYPSVGEDTGLPVNAGFERGMVGWHPRSNEDLPNHVIDEEITRTGDKSGRIDGSGYYYSSHMPCEPGVTVKASAWLRTESNTEGGGYLGIYFYQGGDCFKSANTDRIGPEGWTKVENELVAPEGTESVRIGLNYFGDGVGWWDDALVEIE